MGLAYFEDFSIAESDEDSDDSEPMEKHKTNGSISATEFLVANPQKCAWRTWHSILKAYHIYTSELLVPE